MAVSCSFKFASTAVLPGLRSRSLCESPATGLLATSAAGASSIKTPLCRWIVIKCVAFFPKGKSNSPTDLSWRQQRLGAPNYAAVLAPLMIITPAGTRAPRPHSHCSGARPIASADTAEFILPPATSLQSPAADSLHAAGGSAGRCRWQPPAAEPPSSRNPPCDGAPQEPHSLLSHDIHL